MEIPHTPLVAVHLFNIFTLGLAMATLDHRMLMPPTSTLKALSRFQCILQTSNAIAKFILQDHVFVITIYITDNI
jgi:hypothetical protein